MKRTLVTLAAAAACSACTGGWPRACPTAMCTTGDEIAHLTAGYSYWKTGDYRLQPENGNLPQRFAALPAAALPARLSFPTLEQDGLEDLRRVGHGLPVVLHGRATTWRDMLREGRRMIALFGVAIGRPRVPTGARRLHGDKAALLGAALFAFCPTMLANGALDHERHDRHLHVPGGSVTAFWALAHRLSPVRLLAAFGLMPWGSCASSKFSAPLDRAHVRDPVGRPRRRRRRGTRGGAAVSRGRIEGRARVALALVAAPRSRRARSPSWSSGPRTASATRCSGRFEPNRVRSLVGWDVLEDQGGPVVPILQLCARARSCFPSRTSTGSHTRTGSRSTARPS
jgi:hypothetical protein